MAARMWRWGDTGCLTSISIDGEYCLNTSSEAPQCLSNGLRGDSNGRSPETFQGISRLVFDLLPNPSIDHLVAVILKYPRREESGRRKSLSPGPIGQHCTGSRIRPSENSPSTHSGE